MTTTDNTNVSKVSANTSNTSSTAAAAVPDYIANQQQAMRNLSGDDTVQAGIQFMAMFSALYQRQGEQMAMHADNIVHKLDDSVIVDINKDDDTPRVSATKTESTTPQNDSNPSSSAGADKSAISRDVDPVSEAKQAMDMLVVGKDQLTAKDIQTMQMLAQLAGQVNTQASLQNGAASESDQQFPFLSYKTLGLSRGLSEKLEEAYKNQRPVRIDLSDTASVILRLAKNGKVSAEFLAGDNAAHFYFMHNLQDLKNRLEAKQLPYGELLLRDQRQDQSQKRQQPQDGQS